ncbi:MAG: hypothetical protein KKC21_01365 [Nitrospinae bacterium]|nr:hypothetical protein [Nitrospinota bacterium]
MDDITTPKFMALSIGFLLLVTAIIFDADGFIFIIDHANLLFHEAGHPIFGMFGQTMSLYGGTLGQLAIPLICGYAFLKQGATASVAVTMLWFFENFFNIARYMADARAHLLPLVGGGEHDWTNIFNRWGVLPHDVTIANFVRFLGWAGLISTMIFVTYKWRRQDG